MPRPTHIVVSPYRTSDAPRMPASCVISRRHMTRVDAQSRWRAPGVDAWVVVVNTEVIEKGQHLDGECLVDLDQADVVDRQAGLTKHPLGRGDRTDSHDLWLDSREGVAHQAHAGRQPQLAGHVLGGNEASRRAIVEPSRVAGGHVPVRPEWGTEAGQPLDGRPWSRLLVLSR